MPRNMMFMRIILESHGKRDIEAGSLWRLPERLRPLFWTHLISDSYFCRSDESMGEEEPLLSRLLAAATAGSPPEGPAQERKPIRVVVAPDAHPEQSNRPDLVPVAAPDPAPVARSRGV
jgi:hypothetical protein